MIALNASRSTHLSIAQKLLRINWPLAALLALAAGAGFVMLYSVADGSIDPWARRQMIRFAAGMIVMIIVALIDIRIWMKLSAPIYLGGLALLVAVELVGSTGMGAQRWISLGFIQLQPSELMKVALVMMLARYYAWAPPEKVSRPLWLLIPLLLTATPMLLVLKQPDLGTAILLAVGAAAVMFIAGVTWWLFIAGTAGVAGLIYAVFASRGTDWQILKDYQFRRIEIFLDPSKDPLGAGYHITQSKIAFGSGGVFGKGFLQGSQSHLNFLPEKHTDFIFTTLAEEFGLVGSIGLLALYLLIMLFCLISVLRMRGRYNRLLASGVAMTFFLFFGINMAMVMGLAPVVGVPLPLISYGGTSMLVLMFAFGLLQSAHVHRGAPNERR